MKGGFENIYAIQSIKAGEEITIIYIEGLISAADRQTELKNKFRFLCRCHGCDLPLKKLHKSDIRRQQMKKLDDAIGNPFSSSARRLRDCYAFLNLLRREFGENNALLSRVYDDAFQLCIGSGDEARASVCAERARLSEVVCLGEDSAEAKRHKMMAINPRADHRYGMVDMKWRQKKDAVPKGLGESEMEKWLFKLE